VDVPALTALQRAVLVAPDIVARAAARTVEVPEQRWLLRQPHAVRCSFLEEVVDRRADPSAAERWMLLQAEPVRLSFVREVLDGGAA
jgi:hypothetical protein